MCGTMLRLVFSELRKTSSCGELDLIPKTLQEVHPESVGHGSLFAPWLPPMTQGLVEFPCSQLGMKYVTQGVRSSSSVAKICIVYCRGMMTAVRRNPRHRLHVYFLP